MTMCKYKKINYSQKQSASPSGRDSFSRKEDESDLLGKIPSVVQRISIIALLSVVIAMLTVCSFVKCPETVRNGKIIYSNQTILEYIFREIVNSVKNKGLLVQNS